MLLHLLSTPTITLMLTLTALKRLWTGRICFCFCDSCLSSLNSQNLLACMSSHGLLFRFAQFFIKPLMSADATMREIKAVDSG